MKKSNAQKKLKEIKRYDEIRRLESELAKEKQIIRESLVGFMGKDRVIQVGDFVLLISEVVKTEIDRGALVADLGDDIRKYEKLNVFNRLDVKKI